jgi:hypothetical protein
MKISIDKFVKDSISLDTSLSAAFSNAWHYFNNRQWDKLQSMLDPLVILKRVSHSNPADLVFTPPAVIKYLQSEVKDKPQFTPLTATFDSVVGSVSGNATWQEITGNGQTVKDTIRYFFLFTYDQSQEQWYLLFLWGSEALQSTSEAA